MKEVQEQVSELSGERDNAHRQLKELAATNQELLNRVKELAEVNEQLNRQLTEMSQSETVSMPTVEEIKKVLDKYRRYKGVRGEAIGWIARDIEEILEPGKSSLK